MKKWMYLLILISLITIIVVGTVIYSNNKTDKITYKDKIYNLLEYKMDIFTYLHNSNVYYEEDVIHPVDFDKWSIVYFNGDLFVLDKQSKKAIKYYKDDRNYEWFIAIEYNDVLTKHSISITQDEIDYLYNMENIKKEETITFNDIELFADIIKLSNDKLIFGLLNLIYYNNQWYWKTEIMKDDNNEYIIKLPLSLSKKIDKVLGVK